MSEIKGAYEVIKDVIKNLINARNRKKAELWNYLETIISLLKEIREKLLSEEIPREEGKALAILVNKADILAKKFKENDPRLEQIFEVRLPKIGELLYKSDVFIKNRDEYRLREETNVLTPYSTDRESVIKEACEEMQRVAGVLSTYELEFRK